MGEVHSSCDGGKGPEGIMADGVVVAEGTAAGGFSVSGLTEELEAAPPEVAVPLELAEAVAVLVSELDPDADEAVLEPVMEADEADIEEEASWAATAATAGSSKASVLRAGSRIVLNGEVDEGAFRGDTVEDDTLEV